MAGSAGVLAVFSFMGVFHVLGLVPLLPSQALWRVGMFFFLNGVATIAEVAVWGKRKHSARAVLAWVFEAGLASWTASKCQIPRGFGGIKWRELCGTGLGIEE